MQEQSINQSIKERKTNELVNQPNRVINRANTITQVSTTQLGGILNVQNKESFSFSNKQKKNPVTKEVSRYMGIVVWRYDLLTSHSELKLSSPPCNYRGHFVSRPG